MEKQSRIYVAGNRGLVGSAIVRKLQEHGYNTKIFVLSNSESAHAICWFRKGKDEGIFSNQFCHYYKDFNLECYLDETPYRKARVVYDWKSERRV